MDLKRVCSAVRGLLRPVGIVGAVGVLATVGLLPVGRVHAGETDRPAAAALFTQGIALVKGGDFEGGCPKFDAAFALWPSSSTAMNIALCHEHFGRTASAWSTYQRALALAGDADGAARQEKLANRARAGIAKHEPQLARISVRIVPSKPLPAGLSIERDGVSYPLATLGVPVPVDPGSTKLVLSAPGYERIERSVDARAGETAEVEIALRKLAAAAEPPLPSATPTATPQVLPGPVPEPPRTSPDHPADAGVPAWAWAVGAGGIVLGAASIASLVMHLDAASELDTSCPGDADTRPRPCPADFDIGAAVSRKNATLGVSLGAGAAGVAALGVAIAGIASASDDDEAGVTASAFVTPQGGGAWLQGVF